MYYFFIYKFIIFRLNPSSASVLQILNKFMIKDTYQVENCNQYITHYLQKRWQFVVKIKLCDLCILLIPRCQADISLTLPQNCVQI